MSDEILVFIAAISPIVELRGAIPLGITLGLPISKVFLLAVLGNILPVPFILIGAKALINLLKKIPLVEKMISNWSSKKAEKLSLKLHHWGWLGLFIFVAIPLPGTGAWTGSIAASLLGLNFYSSLVSIILGVTTAGLLITAAGLAMTTSF